MKGEKKENAGKRVVNCILTAILSVALAAFVFVVMYF